MSLKIYFAGPNVFHPLVKEMESEIVQLSKDMGFTALIPGDSGINWNNPDKKEIAREIFAINLEHLDNCDGVIANVTPFRGACVDDGTAWEIGYAHARKVPIVTYGSGPATTGEIIESVSGVDPSFENPRRDLKGFLIEEFGFHNNLMISCSTRHFHLDFDPYSNIRAALSDALPCLLNSMKER